MAEKQAFGDVLVQLRKRRGLTQQDVADQIGVTRSAVYGFEKGRSYPVADKLLILARFFEVSVDYMLTGENYTTPSKTDKAAPAEDTGPKNPVVSAQPFGLDSPVEYEHGEPVTHEGRTVPTFQVKGAHKPEPPGTDLVRQVAKNTREIALMQQALTTALAELRQLSK